MNSILVFNAFITNAVTFISTVIFMTIEHSMIMYTYSYDIYISQILSITVCLCPNYTSSLRLCTDYCVLLHSSQKNIIHMPHITPQSLLSLIINTKIIIIYFNIMWIFPSKFQNIPPQDDNLRYIIKTSITYI